MMDVKEIEREANIQEALRCLNCKIPFCEKGCPVDTKVKEIIQMYLNNKLLRAGDILFKNNPLSIVCSLVCPHEKQCEGMCVLNKKTYGVKFGDIENEISSKYIESLDFRIHRTETKKSKVAIIGGGPAGITIAFILTFRGYDVTIFEAHAQIGGVLRYGIPEFRLPKTNIDKLEDKLIEIGVKIRPNIIIGPALTIDDLFEDGYNAIFIGTGTWNPRKLGIRGESFGNVHFAIDYLKSPEFYKLGKKVVIIGAGNVAVDAARTMIRNGIKHVILINREGEEGITANKKEFDHAIEEGVKILNFRTPIEIKDDGLVVAETKILKDKEGNILYKYDEESKMLIEADSVIISISQGPRSNIVSKDKEIEVNEKGLIVTNNEGSTTKPGVFSGGDVVTGAKTVVEAVKMSKIIADKIDEYLIGCEEKKDGKIKNDKRDE
ncbi:MAG: NAD(P)-dependent oxidoreductase [Leptotrichiaceae bacterium]|jgi:glutamate synthase (NADPH/NADH) small chain